MSQAIRVQGRCLTPNDVIYIRQLIADHPKWSRRRLSIELCVRWQWRNGKGDLKDMACRSMLLKLHERNFVHLPSRRQVPTNRMAKRRVNDVAHDTSPITQDLRSLQPLHIINVHQQQDYEPLYRCLISRYHYLGYTGTVGENMRYLVVDREHRPLACLLFGSAAWSCHSRDSYIGWDQVDRAHNLALITNNTRFLILPWVNTTNLASYVLGSVSRRISQDWLLRYGHPVCTLETFVDVSRISGTCYRAANWQRVGQTQGRGRNDRHTQRQAGIKSVFMYPLVTDYQRRLTCNGASTR